MRYKQLLVGVDFSPCSADALREAVRLAAHEQARVTAVHVLDDEVVRYLKSHTVLDEARTMDEALVHLKEFVRTNDGDSVDAIVVQGHPFAELLSVANDKVADLLLLGARGHGSDSRHLGTIASKCLRKAPFPLLLVQDREGAPFRQIVCCVDYSSTCKRAVAAAIRVAKLEHAALDFVHVYASPHAYQDTDAPYMITGFANPEDFAKQMRQNLANFLFQFEHEMEGIEVTQSLVDRIGAGAGIADHVRDMKADLLVLGTRGRTGWKRLLLGTTAEHVVHRVPCSILTVKPENFTFELH